MKVSIIGGGGRVGADAAYALQFGGIVREIVLVDANEDMAAGEALDLLHGSSLIANQKIYSGSYNAVNHSDCVIITAGLRRKPDESRLELIERNVGLFNGILDNLKKTKLSENACILVVSNPVDILTHLAVKSNIVPENKVIGLGTVLDTTRFRSLIGEHFNLNPCDIKALVLGEHGDSMVPIWSSATIGGIPIQSIKGFSDKIAEEIFDRTKKSGAEVIRLKGGAGRAVGLSIRSVVESIALDKEAILPVSSLQKGQLDISGVCLSLPTIVGKQGVQEVITPIINKKEHEGLLSSAESLKKVLNHLNEKK